MSGFGPTRALRVTFAFGLERDNRKIVRQLSSARSSSRSSAWSRRLVAVYALIQCASREPCAVLGSDLLAGAPRSSCSEPEILTAGAAQLSLDPQRGPRPRSTHGSRGVERERRALAATFLRLHRLTRFLGAFHKTDSAPARRQASHRSGGRTARWVCGMPLPTARAARARRGRAPSSARGRARPSRAPAPRAARD